MSQIRNVFHEKIIQFLVVFILWHFETFLLSVVVATIGIGVAGIAVVTKTVIAVVGISRRLGSGGSLGGPLAVDYGTIGIGVASIAEMAEAVVAVVRLRLGSGSSFSRPLAIVVAAIGIREASVAVVSKTIVAVVRISLGISLRGAHGQGDHGENNQSLDHAAA